MKTPAKKLSKLAMPEKRQEDYGALDLQQDEDADHGDESADVAPDGDHADAKDPAADLSDDDLLAEVKKRGLAKKLEDDEEASESPDEEAAEGDDGDDSMPLAPTKLGGRSAY